MAAALRTHCERAPRNVLTSRWPSTIEPTTGVERALPLFRPVVWSTTSPVGSRPGEPHPARTAGPTKALMVAKKVRSRAAALSLAGAAS